MGDMQLAIKGVNVSLTPSLRRYVEEKLVRSVTRIFARDPGWEATTLELELICETHHHKKGMIWKAVANLKLPGKRFRHDAEAEDIHAAVDGLEDILKREFTKYKERSRSRLLRGARQAKKSIHLDRSARLFRKGRIREEGA
ncbi:MAG: ribosomal subunit interface protein [Candidatus Sungbacteria bacterium RIFCSPLOWO2_01_FULL_60_25]|uniref:Ribosomal subunit interface protein n=1 Tax=Candidatus Sungbacteria bacterium RIFCSPLOWO2_01_FULL_60_25 TaxID=1802281 RepID=A0A1G2LBF9_9BACT|nr:MAG: ribosomal subunit interface protein [Candidatus Sungbacteria bacterium RIFCSPLOWO2_01_FULL_60_25]